MIKLWFFIFKKGIYNEQEAQKWAYDSWNFRKTNDLNNANNETIILKLSLISIEKGLRNLLE